MNFCIDWYSLNLFFESLYYMISITLPWQTFILTMLGGLRWTQPNNIGANPRIYVWTATTKVPSLATANRAIPSKIRWVWKQLVYMQFIFNLFFPPLLPLFRLFYRWTFGRDISVVEYHLSWNIIWYANLLRKLVKSSVSSWSFSLL